MYDDKVIVVSEATNISVECDVMEFSHRKRLIAVVNRIKITMYYESQTKKYIGTAAGLNFMSDGPKEHGVKTKQYE